ncbi:hypothetical protein E6P78_28200 [Streptomyces sp. A0958]|uniref:hypothetical protein n=1 Tax=Streptomyces sp. A0958 TaxID=2563101 RepID=UPI00109EB381|nr:hypothetical protein [Streptomyces sp. A0958]THA59938.1 hypothetical protein E6P78_28200 [Streptomyces sp. A0958]
MSMHIHVTVAYPDGDEMERVLGLAEAVGEPVSVTFRWEAGETPEDAVLVPAATLARWEHWAPTAYPSSDTEGEDEDKDEGEGEGEDRAAREQPELAHPTEFGEFTLYRRRAGGRTAVARNGVVVAELLAPGEARWLREKARDVRQGFMDPKQKAAFEEFLARQASVE